MTAAPRSGALLLRIGAQACCIPLAHVIETMRPLPIVVMNGMPPFVKGLATIRGSALPVVDVAGALGEVSSGPSPRFVALRVGQRRVALLVDAVLGVRDLDASRLEAMPPLLRRASADLIEAIETLDAKLLIVLQATRLLNEDAWRTLDAAGAAG
jgi:purine-binding chemotaxis protein CheW